MFNFKWTGIDLFPGKKSLQKKLNKNENQKKLISTEEIKTKIKYMVSLNVKCPTNSVLVETN